MLAAVMLGWAALGYALLIAWPRGVAGDTNAEVDAAEPSRPVSPRAGDVRPELRVCADPNNLPFSNARGEGFENAIAEVMAEELDRTVSYTFWPQRRGFIRHTLRAERCDVVIGVPSSFEMVQTTAPYYRSTYVFVARRNRGLRIRSLDDPRLRTLRIGFHAVGDDGSNVPPVQALAARGIVSNLRGYSIYGDYSQPNPPRALIDAVARGEVDVAVAWGPLAGYFAQRADIPLEVTPIDGDPDPGSPQMAFDISMGVRRGDTDLKAALEGAIVARRKEIRALLVRYGVPLADGPHTVARSSQKGS